MEVALAPVDEIPEGGIKKVDFFGREVLLTKTHGRPRAIMNCCMHLGGPLSRMERSWCALGIKPKGARQRQEDLRPGAGRSPDDPPDQGARRGAELRLCRRQLKAKLVFVGVA